MARMTDSPEVTDHRGYEDMEPEPELGFCANCAALQDQIDAMTEDMREMQAELRYLR